MNKLIKNNVAYLFILSLSIGQITPFVDALREGMDEKYRDMENRVARGSFGDILDGGMTIEVLRDMISLPSLGPATIDMNAGRQVNRCL